MNGRAAAPAEAIGCTAPAAVSPQARDAATVTPAVRHVPSKAPAGITRDPWRKVATHSASLYIRTVAMSLLATTAEVEAAVVQEATAGGAVAMQAVGLVEAVAAVNPLTVIRAHR